VLLVWVPAVLTAAARGLRDAALGVAHTLLAGLGG